MPEEKQENVPLNIAFPPDFVFKYPRPSRVNPSRVVLKEDGVFNFIGVKYPKLYHETDEFYEKNNLKREWFKYPVAFRVNEKGNTEIFVHTEHPPLTPLEEKMGGQLSCFSDVPFPYKGHPFPEALYAVNQAKRLSRQFIEMFAKREMLPFFRTFIFMRKKKKIKILEHFLLSFAELSGKAMDVYVLSPDYMTKYGKEIYYFLTRALVKYGISQEIAERFSEQFAGQIDWDNAYWMRLGDTMAESSKERMLENPRKELLRLSDFIFDRNPTDPITGKRLKKLFKMVSYLLYIPRYKQIFKECIKESNFENFQFDDGDRYHCLLYADYNYLGKTIEERLKMYDEYHKKNPPFPSRMVLKPS